MPVNCKGSFHPKVWLLSDGSKTALLVGSGQCAGVRLDLLIFARALITSTINSSSVTYLHNFRP